MRHMTKLISALARDRNRSRRGECFADPQSSAPEHNDDGAESDAIGSGAGRRSPAAS